MTRKRTKTKTPVGGDGVITVTAGEGETKMSGVDLPENIAAALQLESVGNIQANNRDGRDVSSAAMGALKASIVRKSDELDVVESRATSGVLATPIAPPTTQGGA